MTHLDIITIIGAGYFFAVLIIKQHTIIREEQS